MIVKRLKKYIDDEGLKKKKVAKTLNISAGHLSYILNGHRDPSLILEYRIEKLIE